MIRSAANELAIVAWQAVGETGFTATSFIVWLFAGVGIALPDGLLALHRSGAIIVGSDLERADLIFRTGKLNLFQPDDTVRGIGHVGLFTGQGVVIHASPRSGGRIAPSSIDWFLDMDDGHFRGTRRILARN